MRKKRNKKLNFYRVTARLQEVKVSKTFLFMGPSRCERRYQLQKCYYLGGVLTYDTELEIHNLIANTAFQKENEELSDTRMSLKILKIMQNFSIISNLLL